MDVLEVAPSASRRRLSPITLGYMLPTVQQRFSELELPPAMESPPTVTFGVGPQRPQTLFSLPFPVGHLRTTGLVLC
jgi:hypothetical protein